MSGCKKEMDNSILNDLSIQKTEPTKEQITDFIKFYRRDMTNDQICLLELMRDKVFGFQLISQDVGIREEFYHQIQYKILCIFSFSFERVEGEIKIYI